jgi:hypothetical protein
MNSLKVKFKTKSFGCLPKDSIVEAKCLIATDEYALLYFPPDKEGSGCLIFGRKKYSEKLGEFYVDLNDRTDYLNFGEEQHGGKFLDKEFKKLLKEMK